MRKIGITGGVGSGKSQILDTLQQEYGAGILKADEISHEQMLPGSAGYQAIVQFFGTDICQADGNIDRKKLGDLVFADPEKLSRLNAILHPAVKQEIVRRMKKAEEEGCPFLVLEAALLLQDGYPDLLDEIWYIYTDREVRIQRLMESRQYSREKCLDIMARQLPEEAYRQAADVVIDNSGVWEDTLHAIHEHCQRQHR